MIGERDSPHQDTRADWLFLYIRRLAEWFRSLICLRRYLKGPNLEKLRQVTFKKPRTGQKKITYLSDSPRLFFLLCILRGLVSQQDGRQWQDVGGCSSFPGRARSDARAVKAEAAALPVLVWGFGLVLRGVRDAPVRSRYVLSYPLNYVLYADSPTVKVIGRSKPFETMAHARDSEPRR